MIKPRQGMSTLGGYRGIFRKFFVGGIEGVYFLMTKCEKTRFLAVI